MKFLLLVLLPLCAAAQIPYYTQPAPPVNAAVGPSCATVADSGASSYYDTVVFGSIDYRAAAGTFVASSSYNCCKVVCRLQNGGTVDAGIHIYAEIRLDSDLSLVGTSSQILTSALPATLGDVTFTFSVAPAVVSGTRYRLCIRVDAADSHGNVIGWGELNGISGQDTYRGDSSSPPVYTLINSNWDTWFTTYH